MSLPKNSLELCISVDVSVETRAHNWCKNEVLYVPSSVFMMMGIAAHKFSLCFVARINVLPGNNVYVTGDNGFRQKSQEQISS